MQTPPYILITLTHLEKVCKMVMGTHRPSAALQFQLYLLFNTLLVV